MRRASFGLLLVLSGSLLSSDVSESDVLFLKIQELENELSILRNELENQAFLIEKLTSEIDTSQTEQLTEETDSNDLEVNFRFEGINDLQSMDELYSTAISSLESGNLSQSKEFFDFIKKYNRYGIPVNIIYGPKNKEGILLPEILSKDIVIDKLIEAGIK